MTITGTINYSNGTAAAGLGITFIPQETAQSQGGVIVATQKTRVCTTTAGALPAAFALAEGRYTVLMDNGDEFEIDVPSGDGPEDIADMTVESDRLPMNYTPSGSGSPEGRIYGEPGWPYTDLDSGTLWIKRTGNNKTGWEEILQ